MATRSASPFLCRHVGLTRAHGDAGILGGHGELVALAIENRRRKTEEILVVQFVDDPLEGVAQALGAGQFEIAATGLVGNLLEPGIRPADTWRPRAPHAAAPHSSTAHAPGGIAGRPFIPERPIA